MIERSAHGADAPLVPMRPRPECGAEGEPAVSPSEDDHVVTDGSDLGRLDDQLMSTGLVRTRPD
ncbi:hypothetical protein [Actinomadura sp. 3N407]|uniref:hypothetical protein n=1 Tax=Actinomadura sp. 3N407 TaxID=3457423 RepID=UPI003FCE4554